MISALGTAAYSIGAQVDRLNQSANRLATSDAQPDYVRETVERMTAEHAVRANIAVMRTADQMTGTLFDILA